MLSSTLSAAYFKMLDFMLKIYVYINLVKMCICAKIKTIIGTR